jgi:uroporphyrinogen-III synthase
VSGGPVVPDRQGRVVMTRQPAQAGDVEAGLREAGWTVRFLPLTDFELPAELADLRTAVDRLRAGGYAWLIVTSPNTVRALARAGWDGTLPQGTQVAVTGPGTARVLAEAGCPVIPWMPDGDASAAGIIAGFPSGPGGAGGSATRGSGAAARVFLPQSALATDEVAEALRSRGWDVERVEAYRTVPYPAASDRRLLADGEVPGQVAADGSGVCAGGQHDTSPATGAGTVVTVRDLAGAVVVLTSPSAARELARQLTVQRDGPGDPADIRFVAIGQPTRRAAGKAGIELIGTAASPDAAGLLDVLDGPSAPRPR